MRRPQDPRREAFALAVARGARFNDAYEDAGFSPRSFQEARLAARPEVAHRIAELPALEEDILSTSQQALLFDLPRLTALQNEAIDAGRRREVRLTLVKICALQKELEMERDTDRQKLRHRLQDCEKEQLTHGEPGSRLWPDPIESAAAPNLQPAMRSPRCVVRRPAMPWRS